MSVHRGVVVVVAVLAAAMAVQLARGSAATPVITAATGQLGGLRPPISPALARLALAQLPVRAETSATPYRRDAYGRRWADVDGNGCNLMVICTG